MITHTLKGTVSRKPTSQSWSPETYILSLTLLGGADDFHNSADRRDSM